LKNKFFVNIELGLFINIFMLLLMIACLCVLLFVPTSTPLDKDIPLLILLVIMLFVLPISIIIIIIFICFPIIEVSETGITKRLFGICLKSYKWEDISEIKCFGNIVAQTVSFYKNRKEDSLFYKLVKKERIYFYCNEKKMTVLRNYAPNFIMTQLFAK